MITRMVFFKKCLSVPPLSIFVLCHDMWEDLTKHTPTHTLLKIKQIEKKKKYERFALSYWRSFWFVWFCQVVIFNKSKGADRWCKMTSTVLFRAAATQLLPSSCCDHVWAHVCACLDFHILLIVQLCLVSKQLYLSLGIDWPPPALKVWVLEDDTNAKE